MGRGDPPVQYQHGRTSGQLLAERYRLTQLLGRGAHGEVWEAFDTMAQVVVAAKLLTVDGTERARVRREVAAMRLLRLPGVVRLLDEGTDDAVAFLLME